MGENGGQKLCSGFFFDCGFAFVITAFVAYPVVSYRSAAVRTYDNSRINRMNIGSSFFSSGCRKPVFWVWHNC